jgi:hypothetical protein
MPFQKWTSINKFSDIYRLAKRNGLETLTLRPKIKLHGTNAAVRVEAGVVTGQKRSSDVHIGSDNAGFAAWLDKIRMQERVDQFLEDHDGEFIIFGEWAGPGVQKADAVSFIPQKTFFPFSVRCLKTGETVFEPSEIQKITDKLFKDDESVVLPWYTSAVTISTLDDTQAQTFMEAAVKEVDEVIGKCDPFIKSMFDVEGVGEGLVFYETTTNHPDYLFKIKSAAHAVTKAGKTYVAPIKPEGMDEFIETFFTENRFEQMLNEQLGGEANRKLTGQFLGAVMKDVSKESVNEIELADFEWKDVAKYAVTPTKKWFFDRCDAIS